MDARSRGLASVRAARIGLRRAVAMIAIAAVGAGVIVGVDAAVAPERSAALSGSEFDPGYIISDANFYNGNAMSAAEIQVFLDAKIGSCLNGLCLNVATVPVDNMAARTSTTTGNLICNAMTGGNLRVSELIYRVQVACGISAKVILVTLQKEQSLVTSRAPSSWALNHAMGMACPDTAPCDVAFAGLARQIVTGTVQLKTYKAARFGRQTGVQYVQYHPNASCSGTNVNVRSFGTAALYNYTPYQPNSAALANLGGTGNSCSSYGNRNFWVYYSNWFGSPTGSPKPYTNTLPFLVARNAAGELLIYTGNGRGGWATAGVIGQGWLSMRLITVGGDFSGDGNRDILAVDNAGALWLYPTNGYAELEGGVQLASSGWADVTSLLAPGDLTGDYIDDLIAIDSAGVMTLHAGTSSGGLATSRVIDGTWAGLLSVFAVGDFNGDRQADLMSIDSAGELWLHPGNGFGQWRAAVKIGTGWSVMDQVLGARDFDGDGAVDLLARTTSGNLWLYRGDGRGGWRNGYIVGNGWNTMNALAAASAPTSAPVARMGFGDLNTNGTSDLLARDTSGALWIYNGLGGGQIGGRTQIPGDWSSSKTFMSVGDFNSDGYRDVISIDASGAMWLHPLVGGAFGTPTQIGTGWQGMSRVLSPGDFNGDDVADILAVDPSGTLWLYAGPALNATNIGSGWDTVTEMLGPGDFDGDGAMDVLVRNQAGDFFNYRGDGAGGWASSFPRIGNGWNIFDYMFAPGDFTGDGNVDIMARRPNGDLWMYPGDGRGGWKAYGAVGVGWNVMSWIG